MSQPPCPRCGVPVRRLQRAAPNTQPSGIFAAYPCADWLTRRQAVAIANAAKGPTTE